MSFIDLHGMGVALVTPFDSNGSIDFESLGNLVDYQIKGGAAYLLVLGTTAETPALSPEERIKVLRFVVERAAGRIPLIAGCGGNNTAEVVHELTTVDLSGYSAVLSVAPFYNKPSQRGIIEHFRVIANVSPLPVVLYNIPGRTGVNMLPDTTLELARTCKNIIGIKEASGIMGQFNRLVAEAPADFAVISGDDSLTLPVLSIGGWGVISVLGNAYPKEFSQMVKLAREGNLTEAQSIHRLFTPLFTLLFTDGNPSGVKCLLSRLGLAKNNLRLPLVPVSEAVYAKIALEVDRIKNICINP